ncbi:MAG: hypothetical protein ACK55I_09925, partial [bacterium]
MAPAKWRCSSPLLIQARLELVPPLVRNRLLPVPHLQLTDHPTGSLAELRILIIASDRQQLA